MKKSVSPYSEMYICIITLSYWYKDADGVSFFLLSFFFYRWQSRRQTLIIKKKYEYETPTANQPTFHSFSSSSSTEIEIKKQCSYELIRMGAENVTGYEDSKVWLQLNEYFLY